VSRGNLAILNAVAVVSVEEQLAPMSGGFDLADETFQTTSNQTRLKICSLDLQHHV
jgi:hypothetical protein